MGIRYKLNNYSQLSFILQEYQVSLAYGAFSEAALKSRLLLHNWYLTWSCCLLHGLIIFIIMSFCGYYCGCSQVTQNIASFTVLSLAPVYRTTSQQIKGNNCIMAKPSLPKRGSTVTVYEHVESKLNWWTDKRVQEQTLLYRHGLALSL